LSGGERYPPFEQPEPDCIIGLEKSVVLLSRTRRFSFWASNFSSSLAQWVRDESICLPTESLKEQTKTYPWQANFESYLSQGQA